MAEYFILWYPFDGKMQIKELVLWQNSLSNDFKTNPQPEKSSELI